MQHGGSFDNNSERLIKGEKRPRRGDATEVSRVDASFGVEDDGLKRQRELNAQVDEVVRQVEQRAAIGAQLAGRGYAAQRNISQAAGLTIP
jgi:hypothetical protein